MRDVNDSDILKIVEPIWLTKNETASRVRGRVEMVLDWAKARKLRTGENPARWRGHLEFSLAKRAHIAPVKHHPALPYEQVPAFVKALRERPSRPFKKEQVPGDEELGRSTLAFEFLILSWMRTDAVQGMRWPEISFTDRVWSVPPERMKGRRAGGKVFRVPLSVRMLEILNLVRPEELRDQLVFPGFRPGRPMSNMTFEMVVRRMNQGTDKDGRPPRWHDPTDRRAIVPHGFRSSAKDWSAELGVYPGEVTEMALAHAIASEVEGAYRRGDLLERRRQLMEDWGTFVSPTTPPSMRPANDVGEAPIDSHRSTA